MTNGAWNQPPGGNWGQPAQPAPQQPQPQQPQYGGAPPMQYPQPQQPQPQYGAPPQQQQYPQQPQQQQYAPQYQQPQQPQQPNFDANPFAGLVPPDPQINRYPYLEPVSETTPAVYKLVINRIRYQPGRRGGKRFYIVEADVEESNNPQRPPGTRCSAFIDMSQQDTWMQHIIAFIAAIHGVDPQDIPKGAPTTPWDGRDWTTVAMESVGDNNPWAGWRVGCTSTHIMTKPKPHAPQGTPFTLNTWSPVDATIVPAMVFAPLQPTAEQIPNQGGGWAPPPPPQNQGAPQPGYPPQGAPQPQGGPPQPGYPPQGAPQPQGGPPQPGYPPQGAPQPQGPWNGAPQPQPGYQPQPQLQPGYQQAPPLPGPPPQGGGGWPQR